MLAATALALALLGPRGRERATASDALGAIVEREALAFGRRLGVIAAARRGGRVPRVGIGDLEVPPSAAWGLVFRGACEELGVGEPPSAAREAVRRHFMRVRRLGRDLRSQSVRADAQLALYRTLRSVASAEIADAYYDVFRPALADPETAHRVASGTLSEVVRRIAQDPEAAEQYVAAYDRAVALLGGRYGEARLALVLERLAPDDRRARWRDAADDGVGRDAVLTIRAHLYRAAVEAGLDLLLIDVS